MAQHTPGPWCVTTGTRVTAAKAKQYGGGKSICSCLPARRTEEAIDEARANARLMAAAPDMLAELREILEFALVERSPLREPEIASIRAVVAKAEGRS